LLELLTLLWWKFFCYAFKVITKLKKIGNTAGVAFATPDTRRELLRKVLVEVKSKAWTQEEEIYRTEQ
jgi:hypothetical protein